MKTAINSLIHPKKTPTMPILEVPNLYQRMNALVEMKATGTPEEFARQMGLSKASLYEHLDILKSLENDLVYNPHRGSFEYVSALAAQESIVR